MKEEKSKKKFWINLYFLYKYKINIYIVRDYFWKFIFLYVYISDVGSRLKGGVDLLESLIRKKLGRGG